MRRGRSCASASSSSTSTAVDAVLVFAFRFRAGSCSLSNSTSESCFGELMLNSSPASSKICALRDASSRSTCCDCAAAPGRRSACPPARWRPAPGSAGVRDRGRHARVPPCAAARAACPTAAAPGPPVRRRKSSACVSGDLRRTESTSLRGRRRPPRAAPCSRHARGQLLERVCRTRRVEQVAGEHRVGLDAAQHDAVTLEHDGVELQIVADLCD